MTDMIIDAHTHIMPAREPMWNWGPDFTVEDLMATMDRDYEVLGETKHIAKAILMTGLGLTSLAGCGLREAHEYLFESVTKFPDRLYLNAIINPRLWGPAELHQLHGWVSQHQLCMIKIHPSMHNYFLPLWGPYPTEESKQLVYPVFEIARALDIPVMIHMGESPQAVPATIAPIAEAFRDVKIIVAHAGSNNEASYTIDAILLARTHENVYLGSSWVQAQDLVQMYYALGASRIIFESDCAPQSVGQQLRAVTNLSLAAPLGVGCSREEVYRMVGRNIAELCHIPLH